MNALETLPDGRLNRLLMERQQLLTPFPGTALELIRCHGVVQTQELDSLALSVFARGGKKLSDQLPGLRREGLITRATLHRNTIHTLATADFLAWQPLYRKRMEESFARWGTPLPENWQLKLRELIGEEPVHQRELRAAFAKLMPQVAPDKYFGFTGGAGLIRVTNEAGEDLGPKELWSFTDYPEWTQEELHEHEKELVRRYLRAFGPARASDFGSWSGLPGGSKLFEEMKEELWLGLDSEGKKIYDLLELPRENPLVETPEAIALPAFDNSVLAFGSRGRIAPFSMEQRDSFFDSPMAPLLWNGFVAATWRFHRAGAKYSVSIKPLVKLATGQRTLLEDSLETLLQALPSAPSEIQWSSDELTVRGSKRKSQA